MRAACFLAVILVAWTFAPAASAQQTQAPAAAGAPATDIYHVQFTKAVPGQAVELGTHLSTPDPKAPMPDHFVVLRHQEGDDWDYVVIQHLGPKVTVDATTLPGPPPGAATRAWHNDTLVSGPSWAEFTKAMGFGSASPIAGAVYVVSVHRQVPGGRQELLKALTQPGPGETKSETGQVLLQHVEGAEWTFLTITRHNSWQDFATARSNAAAASGAGGWADVRRHSAFHRDTIADRVFPK